MPKGFVVKKKSLKFPAKVCWWQVLCARVSPGLSFSQRSGCGPHRQSLVPYILCCDLTATGSWHSANWLLSTLGRQLTSGAAWAQMPRQWQLWPCARPPWFGLPWQWSGWVIDTATQCLAPAFFTLLWQHSHSAVQAPNNLKGGVRRIFPAVSGCLFLDLKVGENSLEISITNRPHHHLGLISIFSFHFSKCTYLPSLRHADVEF